MSATPYRPRRHRWTSKRARFYVSRWRGDDSRRTWFAVFDRPAQMANPLRTVGPCCLRTTRQGAENYVAQLWREIRTERAFNARRRARQARDAARYAADKALTVKRATLRRG